MNIEDLKIYVEQIRNIHKDTDKHTGYEINDRAIFINKILKPLGYSENNILQDVPQKGEKGSKSADIRLYGINEYKSKHSHSQFVIETKNYKLLSEKNYEIDYLQLKRYIKFNESKIRLIALTDYQFLYLFNATEIKRNTGMNFRNLASVSKTEIEIFKINCFMTINLEFVEEKTVRALEILSYKKIFENQKFINPQDYEATNSIIDPHVRKNFILVLYHLMIKLQKEIVPTFELKILDVQSQVSMKNIDRMSLNKLLTEPKNLPIRNYFLWGFEMNYLDNFIDNKYKFSIDQINFFLSDREKKDAFVLTSIYNLINKTMFLRILEDTSTNTTRFVEGIRNGRYISNGILEEKRKEGRDALVKYFIEVFKFEQADLKVYDFVLSKDIYNWVLDLDEYLITDLLVELIRLFNDINFNKVNQDILGDIYEHYLEQEEEEASKKTYRRLLGQYYTPKPIVRFMWYLTRDVIKKAYGRDIYDKDENYLSIVDPACGSGTFISEAILQINEAASKTKINKDSKVFGFIRDRNESKRIEDNLFGFELNPLSKSIADINLFFALIQAYGGYSREEIIDMINVYRADSLTLNSEVVQEDLDFEEKIMFLQEDIKKSYLQKHNLNKAKKKKFNIVIGNPPYGPTKVNEEMKTNILPFAFPEYNFNKKGENIKFEWNKSNNKSNVPIEEKNLGKLNDLYSYFFGVADYLCDENGVISFITSNTYLTIPSYKWFRKYVLENYTIDYLINFNKVSEKGNSMFYPDAGVATCIIIMRKQTPDPAHELNYLDLSNIDNIKDKYEAFSNIEWGIRTGKLNKNDIKKFEVKEIRKIDFKTIAQSEFLKKNDYVFLLGEASEIEVLDKIEGQSISVTAYSPKNMGVDLGDLILAKGTPNEVKDVMENIIFKKELKGLNDTLKTHLTSQFKAEKIKMNFDKSKVVKFVYQKHLQPYGMNQINYTYLDPDILWRARIKNRRNLLDNPINSKYKLFLLERRAKEQILSLVTDENIVPQHGGRFMYLVQSDLLDLDDMYFLSAVINSKVVQYLYKKRLIGNKDILVPKIKNVNEDLKSEIIEISKKIHLIEKQKFNYYNSSFEFGEENGIKVNVLNDSPYWNLNINDGLIQDFYVGNIQIDLDENCIYLNNSIILTTKGGINLQQLYEQVKEYTGNLLENPLLINTIRLTGSEKSYLKELDDKCMRLKQNIDELVYKIYNLTNEEIQVIN